MSVIRSVGLAGVSTKTSFEVGERGRGSGQCVAISGRHADHGEPERLEHLVDEVLRAAVERLRVKDRAPRGTNAKQQVAIAAMPELKTAAHFAARSSGTS